MERPIIVATAERAIIFGYTDDSTGQVVRLKRARNCIYWPIENGGLFGLASEGPHKKARISAEAPEVEARNVVAVFEPSPIAIEKWEAASVYRG